MIRDYILKAILYAVPLLFGVIVHEVAHGWVAERRGDQTARLMGRITLNPLVHIDLFGTVLLPLILLLSHSPFLFGWAKPVPVNFATLRGGRRDMALVAAAGPVTNLLIAVLSSVLYHLILTMFQSGWIYGRSTAAMIAEPLLLMARISVTFNLVLMLVNLLPIPPLDGGRIAVGLLPYSLASLMDRFERFGMLIVLVLFMTGAWSYMLNPLLNVFLRAFLG